MGPTNRMDHLRLLDDLFHSNFMLARYHLLLVVASLMPFQ
uniref:Uncharacterized protein n=1 Tax=Arundo donax TaxID=35708 RepID=A0A0A9B6W2_ARUDO